MIFLVNNTRIFEEIPTVSKFWGVPKLPGVLKLLQLYRPTDPRFIVYSTSASKNFPRLILV